MRTPKKPIAGAPPRAADKKTKGIVMKTTSNQFRAAGVLTGLLASLVGCTSVTPPTSRLQEPSTPPVIAQAGENFRPPVVKRAVAPEFPSELRRIGATGVVTVECVVDAGGQVQNPKVVQASDEALISPALYAIWRWEFQPATRDGQPVATKTIIPIKFELAQDPQLAALFPKKEPR